ncbi:MAG: methanethiol S-methyltransferase [Gammaproteobacteria bacterium]
MKRITAFIYGTASYLVFFVSLLYLFGFLTSVGVPKAINDGTATPFLLAFVINTGLILLFGLQHSVMARPAFKRWWTRMVPKSVERSTYVLLSSGIFFLLFWQWRPMPGVIWQFESFAALTTAWALFGAGIAILFASTFVINHFDLFGLRQVWLNLTNKPYTYLKFKVTWFYKFVRHPLYVGWFLIFWATPLMTLGHLLLAMGMGAYMLIAIRYEERDLETFHGEAYREYKRKVPMLIPRPGKVHATVKPAKEAPLAGA